MSSNIQELKSLATTLRVLSAEAVQKANSGHPGMPMGAADYAALLWADYLRFHPGDPKWQGRDRFVLSAGHGSMLLYALLHLFEFDLPLSEIEAFRQWESRTPGHPEFGLTPGVETTTGPLGQGFANGVGMALSGQLLNQRYQSELFRSRVFGIVSDGDLMEGVASEAASLAGHLKLSNLVYLYDDNHISIGGSTDLCFTESVPQRFEAYGWFVQSVDGQDISAVRACLDQAVVENGRPSLICARTVIAWGSPNKAGTAESHGAPLGEDELKLTKKELGWESQEAFFIPPEVQTFCSKRVEEKKGDYQEWQTQFSEWSAQAGALSEQFSNRLARAIPPELKNDLFQELQQTEKTATRALSGQALQVIARHVPFLIGGSADLEPSNKTLIKDSGDISASDFSARNIRFGVREHAMGSLANGLAYTGSWIPYTGTFLVFADYMRPAMRLAALSHLQTLFIFTHDSFWVGEDGPTHQPIEQIVSLRAIPNLKVFRPADGMETAACYWQALQRKDGPSTLLFTRQKVPALKRESGFQPGDLERGAYVLSGGDESSLVLVATGSEVWLAQEAARILEGQGLSVRVVSMPCVELFLEQDAEYQRNVLLSSARRVSIEAGSTLGWQRIVGGDGLTIGIDHYGASAPGAVLAEKFGFTAEQIAQKIQTWL